MPGGLHPTLAVLAEWPTTPSLHPVTRGWGLPVLIIVLYILAALAVGGRMVARFVYLRNGGIDDVFIILSFVGFLQSCPNIIADQCAQIVLTGFIITNIGGQHLASYLDNATHS
jgi:hypothetical protein